MRGVCDNMSIEPNVGSTLSSILSIESGTPGVLPPGPFGKAEVMDEGADASGLVSSQPMASAPDSVASQSEWPYLVRHKFNRFDPGNESINQFMNRFDDFAEHYRWTDKSQLFYLKQSIPRECEHILWDKGIHNSVEELVKSLRDLYSDSARSTRSRRELRLLIRNK